MLKFVVHFGKRLEADGDVAAEEEERVVARKLPEAMLKPPKDAAATQEL